MDENSRPATAEDFAWADAVFLSGMHIQRPQIQDIVRRAHAAGKPVVLGGPSVSGCPEHYPDADLSQVGEMGDATDADRVARRARGRPAAQLRFETKDACRSPTSRSPPTADPAREYFIANIQFSSGCPYSCEFCDIPALYGRNPRLKTPGRCCAELDPSPRRRRGRDLLRGRQLHRQPEGGARAPPAPGGLAEAQPVPAALRLRGDAEHRQERARAGAHARRRLHHACSAASRRPEPDALRAMSRTRISACRSSMRSEAQQLRPRGGLRHHPRARHRHPTRPTGT